MAPPSIVVLMGVSGSGKSTIGQLLADRLGWTFDDGDAFHPPENVAKMSRGIPLEDDDRRPWLQAMHDALAEVLAKGEQAVLAASLLKQWYRDSVLNGLESVALVYLKAEPSVLEQRLESRRGHFFHVELLRSQLEILEEPLDALVVDASLPAATVVSSIIDELGLKSR